MRWQNRRQSSNIEDRRGKRQLVGGGVGVVGILVVLAGIFFNVDLSGVLKLLEQSDNLSGATDTTAAVVEQNEEEKTLRDLAAVVLADTEDAWAEFFRQNKLQYSEPTLVLYRDVTRSACGTGQSVMGPFYCPADEKIYLDLSFYDDMKYKLKADGEFAFAYVLAHEVGHHVQNMLGITADFARQRSALTATQANRASVKIELQADCFAGVWANYMQQKKVVDERDIEQAINSAASVGDDRLQRQTRGYVVEDSFTHGSSKQRMEWFKKGMQSGNPAQCNL